MWWCPPVWWYPARGRNSQGRPIPYPDLPALDHGIASVCGQHRPDGTDGSPRGDDGPVVLELDPQTLAMPDWRGNNRLDSLRNIVVDGRVSLMFIVPGTNTVVRLNGRARLTADPDMRARFLNMQ